MELLFGFRGKVPVCGYAEGRPRPRGFGAVEGTSVLTATTQLEPRPGPPPTCKLHVQTPTCNLLLFGAHVLELCKDYDDVVVTTQPQVARHMQLFNLVLLYR